MRVTGGDIIVHGEVLKELIDANVGPSGIVCEPVQQVNKNEFVCLVKNCDGRFTQKGHWRLHYESIHELKKWKCDQCDHEATEHGHLKTHMRTHVMSDRYFCHEENCDYSAAQKRDLDNHVASKHKLRRFECVCGETFTSKDGYDRHYQKKHLHLEREYKCPFEACLKVFSSQTGQHLHIEATHHGIRHTCHKCSRSFVDKKNLKLHLKKKHNKI